MIEGAVYKYGLNHYVVTGVIIKNGHVRITLWCLERECEETEGSDSFVKYFNVIPNSIPSPEDDPVGTCLVEFSFQGKGVTQERFNVFKRGDAWTVIFPTNVTLKTGDTMTIKEYEFYA